MLVGAAVTLPTLVVLAWVWAASLVPDDYSVMGMGYVDLGGGAAVAGHGEHGAAAAGGWAGPARRAGDVSVAELTGPRDEQPDVSVELVAEQRRFVLGSGEEVDGYTLNGSSPGPEIRLRQGDLVEVVLVNASVEDGTTLHWHGIDVPNAEDGVAGVTQDAVPVGGRHTYRFVVEDAGTYWYHSHQVSHEQVRRGLWGTLVVEPREGVAEDVDVTAAVHTYDGLRTVGGRTGEQRVEAPAGASVRVRVVSTNDGPLRAWVQGGTARVLAVDGTDVHRPGPLDGRAVVVTAGGRADLGIDVPGDGTAVRVGLGGGTSLLVGPAGAEAPPEEAPKEVLDLLTYGEPAAVPFDPDDADRTFTYAVSKRPSLLDGRPGLHWAVNGRVFPNVPMFLVEEGDVVRVTMRNDSGEVHPMHLHGHHALVLSRDGVDASGSPWWVDSLDVAAGESYELAFVADNPGVWASHCHDLRHAADGLVAHLAYAGVWEPFRVGGQARNTPE